MAERLLDFSQKEELRKKVEEMIMKNKKYLQEHPELPVMLQEYWREVCRKHPTDLDEFAKEFFTDPNLQSKIESLMNKAKPANNE